jgi:hypothetical protein
MNKNAGKVSKTVVTKPWKLRAHSDVHEFKMRFADIKFGMSNKEGGLVQR